jgi:hypothetical protein
MVRYPVAFRRMKRLHPPMLVRDWTVLVGWWNRHRPFGEKWKVEGLGFGLEMVRYPEMPPLEQLAVLRC